LPSTPSRTPITPAPPSRTPAPLLPADTHPTWANLIKGTIQHEWSYPAAGMLIFNLNLQWKRDPSRLPQLIEQVHRFFQRYQHLLSYDIARVFS